MGKFDWGIKGFQGVTLIDYPGRVASLIFFGGCNFRCPFCHNPSLVLPEKLLSSESIPEKEILKKLELRKKLISAVVISGGEPTLYKGLISFLKEIKSLDLFIKLDTNGSFPQVIEKILSDDLVDFIAVDIKTSYLKYPMATGGWEFDKVKETIKLVMESKCKYLFRTTLVPQIVNENDIYLIGEKVKGAKLYHLQQFRSHVTLDPAYENLPPYSIDTIRRMAEVLSNYVQKVELLC